MASIQLAYGAERRRVLVILLVFVLGLAAIGLLVVVAVRVAWQEGLSHAKGDAAQLAHELRHRADQTIEQVGTMERDLDPYRTDPCGAAAMKVMQRLDVGSEQLQAIGYVKDDAFVCSSLGPTSEKIALGPPNFRSAIMRDIWIDAEFPFDQGEKYLVVGAPSGFAAIIHPRVILDIVAEDRDIDAALVGNYNQRVLLSRGVIEPKWLAKLGTNRSAQYFDGKRIIALERTQNGLNVAYVAIPATNLTDEADRMLTILLPIAAVLGLTLAGALWALARMQRSLPTRIKAGLRRHEFHVAYQPVVEMDGGHVAGVEVLLRWSPREGPGASPDTVISTAEEAGIGRKITEYVVEMAFRECAEIMRRRPDFHIAVNVSASELTSLELVSLLGRKARQYSIDLARVIVEATERSLINTDAGSEVLRELHRLGVSVAIDDFGTGYSNLRYLHTLSIDYLKIDRSFVQTIGTGAATSSVVFHIIRMASSLGLDVVAEGVETEEQAAFLREHGIRLAQGWLYAKPMTLRDLGEYIGREALLQDPASR